MTCGLPQVALLAWALLSPVHAGTQPVVMSAVVGAVANIIKLNKFFPPAASSEASAESKAQGESVDVTTPCRGPMLGCVPGLVQASTGRLVKKQLPIPKAKLVSLRNEGVNTGLDNFATAKCSLQL